MATNTQPTATSADEVITIPTSGASYPAFLEPLTPNEISLLKMYDTIKQHEREAAHIKAEEAKRRLEEADERYRAKVREREMSVMNGAAEVDSTAAKIEKGERRKHHDDDDDNAISDTNDRETNDNNDDDDDIDKKSINERKRKRENELSQLRQDVSAAKQAQRQKEEEKQQAKNKAEEMRRELLGVNAREKIGAIVNNTNVDEEDDDESDRLDGFDAFDDAKVGQQKQREQTISSGPTIKKKQRVSASDEYTSGTQHTRQQQQQPSLIANIVNPELTPIHDFSKQLDMTAGGGSILFPIPGDDNLQAPWSPPDAPMDFIDGCLELMLPDFDPSSTSSTGNNTLAIKFQAPYESQRFSINIATCTKNNSRYDDILFHFNPRQFQKGGQLVINDRKETIWGNDISIPLSTIPLIFGARSGSTLVVQINTEGFDVYVEGVHCARLEHRTKVLLPEGNNNNNQQQLPSLILQFPSSNDYADPENWLVHRVWWGHKPVMYDESTLDRIPGVNIYSAVHPRKLFISGLPRLSSDPEVDLRKAELERAFRKYGGSTGAVAVSVQKNSGFAFVDVASEELADLAVAEMSGNGQYRVSKARRTRHEALLEERAAKERNDAEGTTTGSKETAGWD